MQCLTVPFAIPLQKSYSQLFGLEAQLPLTQKNFLRIQVKPHSAKLHALEYVRTNPGQACPASWNTGNKTLKPGIDIAGMVAEYLNK